MPDRAAFWRAMPKGELHVHLRGAMPPAIFADLLNRYPADTLAGRATERHLARWQQYDNIRPFLTPRQWSVAEVAALFRFESFEQFLVTFGFTGFFVRTADDLRRLIAGVLDSLIAHGVVYAEIIISVAEYERQGIALPDLVACLDEAARRPDIRVQWIVDLVRDFGPAAGLALLDRLAPLGSRSIVGITLGGSEHRFPPAQFAAVYARARGYGLRLTVHAGEALGPSSVWDALALLGVERIGHGVRAIEDPALVAHLAARGVPLEVCPTSNLRTGIYPSYAAHPVRALHAAGVPITLNSDDPTFFGATLADECAAIEATGAPPADIVAMIRNSFRYAFLPPATIDAYLAQVDAAWSSHG